MNTNLLSTIDNDQVIALLARFYAWVDTWPDPDQDNGTTDPANTVVGSAESVVEHPTQNNGLDA